MRYLRIALCVVGILLIAFCIGGIKNHFSSKGMKNGQIDLRNHEKNLPIMSPIIEPRDFSKQSLFLLVIVSSSPNKQENANRRKMLRRTWANINGAHIPSDLAWKVVFMLGKPPNHEMNRSIMAEREKHGDLLVGDYKDEYRNITTKLLMAFQWASQIKCNYILKTDDDVYVDIPKLFMWLRTQGDNNSFYGGVLNNGVVVRDKAHRHYVSPEDLSLDYYPVYCKGSMYVLSSDLVPKMVELSKQIKRIGPDDAYVGLLAYHLGVRSVKIQEFFQNSILYLFIGLISTCQFQKLMGIGDSLTPYQVHYIHQLKTTNSNSEKFFPVCISLYMKFCLLFFLCCALLSIFCYRHKWRLKIK